VSLSGTKRDGVSFNTSSHSILRHIQYFSFSREVYESASAALAVVRQLCHEVRIKGAGGNSGEDSSSGIIDMVASVLRRGQVAVVQADSEDGFALDSISFMLLAPVGSGTTIYFTDRSWNGTTFAGAGGGEGTYAWTAAADIAAGTIITISEAELTAAGIELSDLGETIYVYQGADANTPTAFLHAIEFGDGNTTFGASLTNTGLSVGASAVAVAADNVMFGERTWNHQADVLFQNINTTANWSGNENSPHTDAVEGTNGHVAPDIQLWIAGISGGHGLFSVNADATQNGGLANGYNVGHHFQNTASDGDATTFTNRFWSPTHILFDTVAGKFFVVDSSGSHDRILQGNISDLINNPGTAPTMTILWRDLPAGTSDGDGITSIQLDKASGHVYFTASNDLLRINYDTANQTATQLFEFGDDEGGNPNFVNELVLDLANNRAFVIQTESFSEFIESPPGSGNFVVGTVMYQNSIHLVSNLSSADTGIGNNTELQLNFAGGYHDADNPFGNQLNEFDNALGRITDVEINTTTGEIWFTAVQINAGTNGEVGGIYRATLSGGTLTVTTIHTETNATNRNYTHIHIDEETGFYYVSSVEPGQGGNHAVYRGSLSASAGTAPTLTGTAIAALGVTEQSSAPNSTETARVTLFSSLTANDIDTPGGDELAGATVRISAGFVNEASTIAGHAVSVDFLRIEGNTSGTIAASGIAYSYNSATGVMTLTGAGTVAEYAAALALVQFSTSGDNVTNDGTSPSRTIAASVFDGLLHSDEITNTVTVTGINDAPVNSDAGANAGTEDTTFVVAGLSVADADADPATAVITVTLSVNSGTLAIQDNVVGGLTAGQIANNGTASVVLTGTQNQINATLAGANGVQHTPGANVNGTVTLTMVSNDGGASGNDPGLTGTGTTEADTDVYNIVVAAVNDAPVRSGDGTEASPAILEDIPFTNLNAPTVSSLFSGQFSDATDNQSAFSGSSANGFAGIAIVADGSNANGNWEYWTGDVWADIGEAALTTARTFDATTLIRFNPTLNYNGPAPTLTAHLIESGGPPITNNGTVNLTGATGGTTIYSSDTVVLSQAVTAVNDVPTSTNLSGDSVTWTEGQALPALLDFGSNATLGDVDSANLDTGTLTVEITSGLVAAEDQLVIRLTGTVSFNATAVFVNGTQIGTYTGAGAGGGPLVVTFDADATPAAVAELIRAIAYTNSAGDAPTDGDRTISWTLVDGDGTANGGVDTLSVSTTLDVVAVNDEPAGGDETIVVNEDDEHPFSLSDFNFSDTDGDALTQVIITTLPSAGALYLNGIQITVAGTAVSAADIDNGLLTYEPAPDANGSGYDNFTFQVQDDGGTANGGLDIDQTPNTITVDVSAVDDVPTAVDDNPTVDADIATDIDVLANDTDIDAGPIEVIEIDGFAASVGIPVTLASGAEVTLNGDGTLDYDPRGRFDYLVSLSTALATGASNFSALDSFGYSINGGTSATVTVTVMGVDGPGDELHGTPGADTITGTTGSDIIFGFEDDDALSGGEGNDTLEGKTGDDGLSGDGGDDRIMGGADDDLLLGGEGNDVLIGNLGADTMQGGAGDDLYHVRDATDVVIENANEGQDMVRSQVDYVLTDHVEDLLIGGSARSGTGNELDNRIFGSGGADTLSGLEGNDILRGRGGRDTIEGGDGDDRIDGGAGKDLLTGGAGRDIFQFRDGDMGAKRSSADIITDFSQADNERIQLNLVDANTALAGDQAFSFIGNALFSGTAGELRYAVIAGDTWISADTDGDGTGDWFVGLLGAYTLTSSDFVL
jgi:hypothetical protein